MTRESVAKRLGLPIVARVVSHAAHAHEPGLFTTAPVPAMRKALKKAGWEVADVDLFEVNEAFAVVAMIAQQELGIDPDKLNVNGGACALGHPIGASGARILCTLISACRRGAARRGWRRCASAAARPPRWRSSWSRFVLSLLETRSGPT
jgi:acetyl-CoA C-acetyltransferase